MNRLSVAVIALILLLAGLTLVVLATGLRGRSEALVGGSLGSVADPAGIPKGDAPDGNENANANGKWMQQYTLVERSGLKFYSQELAGKVHVVNFFFTACPTVCRLQTGVVQALANEFGPQGVTFLSITCDPETDTPAVLNVYAQQFAADPKNWLFLTGDMAYLRRVAAEVYFMPLDKGVHSEVLLVHDKSGKTRGRFSWKREPELAAMKKLMTELLAEPTQLGIDNP